MSEKFENIKNVLVVGNGFDLDHGLPTRYSDFMSFIISVYHEKTEQYKINSKTLPILKSLITENILYAHLVRIHSENLSGENWIDFESEISVVIQAIDEHSQNLDETLEKFINYYEHPASIKSIRDKRLTIFCTQTSAYLFDNEKEIISKYTFRNFRKRLFNDLQRLILALEIYLVEIIEKKSSISESNALKGINFDRIISFNYTHTAKNKFSNAEVTYIHGECKSQPVLYDERISIYERIKKAINQNNMVIGIDEYFEDERKDSHTNYAIFKKFVQRIQKQNDRFTDSIITNSSSDAMGGYGTTHIHIFGHSLEVTDKDILRRIFLHTKVTKIIVYCYDKPTQGEYISNIIKIIGQDELLKYTESGKIEFRIIT